MEWSNQRNRTSNTSKKTIRLVVIACIVYFVIVMLRGFFQGSILQGKDRVNMVFYGHSPSVISIGLADSISYIINFDNEVKVKTMGGYGYYKIGSLEKLSVLEKDQDLLRRTFSSVISAHVDLYFVPKNEQIYFTTSAHKSFSPSKLDFLKIILSPSYKTNASFVDRIHLFFLIARKKKIDVIPLKTTFMAKEEGDKVFDEESFKDYFQGFFYEPKIRDERADVKLVYTKTYLSAKNLARILEGEGIRVVDLSQTSSVKDGCTLYVDKDSAKKQGILPLSLAYNKSKTVHYIQNVYGCEVKIRHIEDADVLLEMGKTLEEKWK